MVEVHDFAASLRARRRHQSAAFAAGVRADSAGDLRNDRCRSPRSPYMHSDYAGGADRTWITASNGSGDAAVSPMYGWASSNTRNRSVASSTPTVATNA